MHRSRKAPFPFLGWLLRLAVVLPFVVFNAAPQARAQEQILDEIVAVVGDQILLRSDIDGLVLGLVQQQRAEYSDGLWADALNQLIDQKVMAIHAKRDPSQNAASDDPGAIRIAVNISPKAAIIPMTLDMSMLDDSIVAWWFYGEGISCFWR